ncbi:MAG: hypothetical protein HBSAPP02_05200 [Phycisphaerae bacterium]|nr:MAG: nucleotide exchange factor GrpE [Planctomycetia bacterium]GJQ25488.1 MAG: hypothetical protein HBSAPP02_05200 [Phycisphaerae bacterium]
MQQANDMKKEEPRIVTPTDDEVKQYADGGAPSDATDAGDAAADQAQPAPADPIDALRREVEEYKDKYLRAQAETVNVSRRLQQQHAQALKHAATDLARELLPVVDSLDRTLEHVNHLPPDDPVGAGVKLLAEEFAKVLKAHGIEPIEAVGRPFDPEIHEALMQDANSTFPAGTVCAELQRGYRLHDRVLRPARVAISADAATGDGKSQGDPNDVSS